MTILLAVLYITLSCSGLVLFKLGSQQGMTVGITMGMLEFKISLISVLGMICYISSFLIYLILVSRADLSKIYPVTTGIIFVAVMIASFLVLNEPISWPKIVGSCCILIGVLLINLF